jgi:iron(III) transport system permease protein
VTAWRVVVLILLALLVGGPLLFPLLDLAAHSSAWSAWGETHRLFGLLRNTALLILGTVGLALPAGTVGAILLYRTDLPLRGLFRFLTILTLFVPLPLFASAWQAALGSGGWLAAPFWTAASPGDPDAAVTGIVWKAWGVGLTAAVWIHTVAALPWVVLLVGQGLCWVERELEEEALTAAPPGRVLWRVTLPRARFALAGAALWVALQAASEISVTDMFQVRTFAEEVYTQLVAPEIVLGDPTGMTSVARAVAVSVPSVLLTWGLVAVALHAWEKRLPPLAVLTGAPRLYPLGWARWPLLLLLLVVVILLTAVPVGSLVWKLGLGGTPQRWSAAVATDHLCKVLQVRGTLVAGSLGTAALAGAGVASLALVTSWLAAGPRWFRVVVLLLVAGAWALPGPIVGLGLKEAINILMRLDPTEVAAQLLYHGPSPAPVLWACLVRFFPHTVAVLWPVLRALPPELRQAAWVEGARPAQELRHVIWPLAAAACAQALLVAAVLSLGELSAGKLVATPGWPSFTHEVFTQMHYGVTNDLAALCLVLLAAVVGGGAAVALARLWLPTKP